MRTLRPREMKQLVAAMPKLMVQLSSFFLQFHSASLRKWQGAKEKSTTSWWPHDKMHDAGGAGGGDGTVYTFEQNASTPLNKVIKYSIHWETDGTTAICLWPFSFSYWIHFTSKINQHLGNLGWVLPFFSRSRASAAPVALQPWRSAMKEPLSLLFHPSLSICLPLTHTHTHTHTHTR